VMQLGWQLHQDLMEHIGGRLNIQAAVAGMRKPLCIVHGTSDESVPEDDARALFEWADSGGAELHLIPGAGHTFGARHPFEQSNPHLEDALNHTLDFFIRHLNTAQ
jgi:uncharacterized protein